MKSPAARQGTLRELNLGLVLREVLGAAATGTTPPSRADVAAATGLTRATVSALVDRLVAGGLLAELDPVPTQRAGRPAVPLVPAGGTLVAIGAEVNVDYLAVRAVDLAGDVLAERVRHADHRGSDPDVVLRVLGAVADEVLDEARARPQAPDDEPPHQPSAPPPPCAPPPRVVGTAVALPGLVGRSTGTLLLAPNLGWREVDVVRVLAESSRTFAEHRPTLANEADLAALAESRVRRPEGLASFVLVSGEVGIGAAIVLDGRVFGGRHGWAGELGHTLVAGSRQLEQVAGQDAMLRAAGLPRDEGVEPLVAALAAGDPAALAAVASAGEALGVALANVLNTVDVPHVVLGGTYARLADHVREPVLAALRAHVLAAPWAEPSVDVARAGSHAAVAGATHAVRDRVVADPTAWLTP
ncbi:ROK family transcriptional regulator [Cellulomonas uda]|uniref:Transcriptional regulator n=1 Tax=Cellulomonas uda TaxID=1714 RepID=A0A4Y3KGZ4_CELUD|nr:ROK family transcriptional regulator [Cellulomonas uda]NII68092.1 putative NBD/HSP70 family sugar kinase [Cellulomonas uda]GEA82210.1 transcriptional regulator [Cellulomonas uda]